ncbi:MAG: alpha/beta hydrolase [Flavobacteriales bacterium]|nr:alpha/beta hydrolase [Flavobacteriales bacterium]
MTWLFGALAFAALCYATLCLLYWLFQERFIFLRYDLALRYRFRFGGRYTECWLDRPDGARLHALWFKAREPKGVVLYFHGHSGNLKRWGRQAARFVALGHDVLMPDPRGYGKSTGRLSEAAVLADAVAWFDWLGPGWPEEYHTLRTFVGQCIRHAGGGTARTAHAAPRDAIQ